MSNIPSDSRIGPKAFRKRNYSAEVAPPIYGIKLHENVVIPAVVQRFGAKMQTKATKRRRRGHVNKRDCTNETKTDDNAP